MSSQAQPESSLAFHFYLVRKNQLPRYDGGMIIEYQRPFRKSKTSGLAGFPFPIESVFPGMHHSIDKHFHRCSKGIVNLQTHTACFVKFIVERRFVRKWIGNILPDFKILLLNDLP